MCTTDYTFFYLAIDWIKVYNKYFDMMSVLTVCVYHIQAIATYE